MTERGRDVMQQNSTCQPVSSMWIIPPRSRAHVDHVLHPPGHVLLHLEGHRQGLPHPGPRVRLLPWLNWTCAKEVIVRGSPTTFI